MNEDQATNDAGAPSRRALLLGAGAVGATTVLAACGTDEPSSTNTPGGVAPPPATSAPPSAPADGGGDVLAKTSDVPEGGGKILGDKGIVITQPSAGTFKGFSNICTHMKCPVAEVAGGTINCTCHKSKFSIEDGSVKQGPATKALPEKKVAVDGENITLA